MRKGYIKVSTVMAAMVFLLTGCGSSFPEMTKEEEQMVGEYAAKVLLRYDANNRSRLVSREEVEAEKLKEQQQKEEVPQPTQEGMQPVDDTPVIEIGQDAGRDTAGSIEEFFGLPEGMSVSYQGYEICDSYPQDNTNNYFTLDATEGKQLLVLQFRIENFSQTEQTIDLLSQNAGIRVTVNGNYTRSVLTTMLIDDMATYMGSISAGEGVDTVLLVEVDDETAERVSSLTLKLKNDLKTCTIQL